MFVNPRSAFVGCPSVVCSSSGSAKNARYARLLPSTRKSSESRAGPSSRTSSSPVSVFGLTTQRYRPRSRGRRPAPLGLADRHRPGRRGRRDPASATATDPSGRRGSCRARCARVSARRRIARRARATESSRHRRRRASRAPTARRAGRSASGCARNRSRRAREARRRGQGRHAPRRRRSRTTKRKEGARVAPAPSPGTRISRSRRRPRRRGCRSRRDLRRQSDQPCRRRCRRRSRRLVGRDGRPRRPGSAPLGVRRGEQFDGPPRHARSCKPPASRCGGWRSRIEEAVAARVGASRRLARPRPSATCGPFPRLPARSGGARARRPLSVPAAVLLLPGAVRRGILSDQTRDIATTAAFAGPPSVAHAEALVRAVELRGTRVDEPLDAMVVGVPWIGCALPARAAQPDHVGSRRPRACATAVAGRLPRYEKAERSCSSIRSRERSPTRRRIRIARSSTRCGPATPSCSSMPRRPPRRINARSVPIATGVRATRCFPMRTGRLPAGARAARTRDRGGEPRRDRRARARIRPSHSVASALEMTHGVAGGHARVGVLLAPPYAPLLRGLTATARARRLRICEASLRPSRESAQSSPR